MNPSKIEWLRTYKPDGTFTKGHVWNIVTGCEKVSRGCKFCYAETMAKRFWGTRKFTDVRIHADKLQLPLMHKKPTRVFVNSMSDLFHPNVPFVFIREAFDVMQQTPHITYIILTKRSKRALAFAIWMCDKVANWKASPNVQIGVSVEDQKQITRIDEIFFFPAHYHIVSCEPLVSAIDLNLTKNPLSWVIAGGESGRSVPPVNADWLRSLRDQCKAANVPFFFKQWGAHGDGTRLLDGIEHNEYITNKPVKFTIGTLDTEIQLESLKY